MVTYILLNGGSWKVKATVEVSLSKVGAKAFGQSWYWSSSQYASDGFGAYILIFSDGARSFNADI